MKVYGAHGVRAWADKSGEINLALDPRSTPLTPYQYAEVVASLRELVVATRPVPATTDGEAA